jgi:putative hydrolase of the HAD superfamily
VRPGALLIDFGGVLTSDVGDAFDTYARTAGLPDGALPTLLREDSAANSMFVGFEVGRVSQAEFEPAFAERLTARFGVEVEAEGLVRGLTAALSPDLEMIAVLRRIRAAGVPVAIVSNSFGMEAYDGYELEAIADLVVISAELGVRKPSRRIYRHAAAALAVDTASCLFVDDLELNLAGAKRLGMAVLHHRLTAETVPAFEQAFAL